MATKKYKFIVEVEVGDPENEEARLLTRKEAVVALNDLIRRAHGRGPRSDNDIYNWNIIYDDASARGKR